MCVYVEVCVCVCVCVCGGGSVYVGGDGVCALSHTKHKINSYDAHSDAQGTFVCDVEGGGGGGWGA